jgi:predicted transcriptional regulator YdeE
MIPNSDWNGFTEKGHLEQMEISARWRDAMNSVADVNRRTLSAQGMERLT